MEEQADHFVCTSIWVYLPHLNHRFADGLRGVCFLAYALQPHVIVNVLELPEPVQNDKAYWEV